MLLVKSVNLIKFIFILLTLNCVSSFSPSFNCVSSFSPSLNCVSSSFPSLIRISCSPPKLNSLTISSHKPNKWTLKASVLEFSSYSEEAPTQYIVKFIIPVDYNCDSYRSYTTTFYFNLNIHPGGCPSFQPPINETIHSPL